MPPCPVNMRFPNCSISVEISQQATDATEKATNKRGLRTTYIPGARVGVCVCRGGLAMRAVIIVEGGAGKWLT